MKKKMIYSYSVLILAIILLMCISYFASFLVLKKYYDRQLASYRIQMEQELAAQEEKSSQTENSMEPGLAQSLDVLETSKSSGTIQPDTDYVLEIYDVAEDYLSEYKLNPPGYLVGLNRVGLEEYLKNYMENIPLDEFQMGLISYHIVSFSTDKVVLRKVYDQSTVPYQYYLVIERGYLVVYYADCKTVYEYTGIEAKNLPEEEQVRLAYGIFLKNQEELYGMLQNYSS